MWWWQHVCDSRLLLQYWLKDNRRLKQRMQESWRRCFSGSTRTAKPCASDHQTTALVVLMPIAMAQRMGFKCPDVSPVVSGRYLTVPASCPWEPNWRTDVRIDWTKRARRMEAIFVIWSQRLQANETYTKDISPHSARLQNKKQCTSMPQLKHKLPRRIYFVKISDHEDASSICVALFTAFEWRKNSTDIFSPHISHFLFAKLY